jgi:hypothetical protein
MLIVDADPGFHKCPFVAGRSSQNGITRSIDG